jgi:cell wall-associated NlpC family hydrolase
VSFDPQTRVVGATTLTDLRKEPSFHTELLTQVTNGFELEVLKSESEWCRVRQKDGYEGWAFAPYLVPSTERPGATHLVAEPTLLLNDAHAVARVPIGTAVRVTDQQGQRARVQLIGNFQPGWADLGSLRPLADLPLPPEQARERILSDARKLTGVYYLWGGNSASGIDCSGLSQLCHKLSGYTIPRDARLQFPVGRPVEFPFRAGDLLFFHGETGRDRITHVGISTGDGWRMIHSSRSRNGVYEDDLDSPACRARREQFVGARSFLA